MIPTWRERITIEKVHINPGYCVHWTTSSWTHPSFLRYLALDFLPLPQTQYITTCLLTRGALSY
ncbi:hypothetical protein B0F90DRAFT_1709954, partial [Multifurca ochricompacta]